MYQPDLLHSDSEGRPQCAFERDDESTCCPLEQDRTHRNERIVVVSTESRLVESSITHHDRLFLSPRERRLHAGSIRRDGRCGAASLRASGLGCCVCEIPFDAGRTDFARVRSAGTQPERVVTKLQRCWALKYDGEAGMLNSLSCFF